MTGQRLSLWVASTASLAEAVLTLALAPCLTAYDAVHVALAEKVSLSLATADKPLVRRLDGTGLDVRRLAEWWTC